MLDIMMIPCLCGYLAKPQSAGGSCRRESKVLQGVLCALGMVESSTAFVVHRVEHPFSLHGPFSSLSLDLIVCTNSSQTDMSRVALRFEKLRLPREEREKTSSIRVKRPYGQFFMPL